MHTPTPQCLMLLLPMENTRLFHARSVKNVSAQKCRAQSFNTFQTTRFGKTARAEAKRKKFMKLLAQSTKAIQGKCFHKIFYESVIKAEENCYDDGKICITSRGEQFAEILKS